MPNTGGMRRNCLDATVIAMVKANSAQIVQPPNLTSASSARTRGRPAGSAKCMIAAGTRKLTTDGTKMRKNSKNSTLCACHTISVVMSPNALQAPPALAATTRLSKARDTKRWFPCPTARMTAAMISAVVRLSRIAERKNATTPVIQNSWRKVNPRLTSSARRASNTLRSVMALT